MGADERSSLRGLVIFAGILVVYLILGWIDLPGCPVLDVPLRFIQIIEISCSFPGTLLSLGILPVILASMFRDVVCGLVNVSRKEACGGTVKRNLEVLYWFILVMSSVLLGLVVLVGFRFYPPDYAPGSSEALGVILLYLVMLVAVSVLTGVFASLLQKHSGVGFESLIGFCALFSILIWLFNYRYPYGYLFKFISRSTEGIYDVDYLYPVVVALIFVPLVFVYQTLFIPWLAGRVGVKRKTDLLVAVNRGVIYAVAGFGMVGIPLGLAYNLPSYFGVFEPWKLANIMDGNQFMIPLFIVCVLVYSLLSALLGLFVYFARTVPQNRQAVQIMLISLFTGLGAAVLDMLGMVGTGAGLYVACGVVSMLYHSEKGRQIGKILVLFFLAVAGFFLYVLAG